MRPEEKGTQKGTSLNGQVYVFYQVQAIENTSKDSVLGVSM